MKTSKVLFTIALGIFIATAAIGQEMTKAEKKAFNIEMKEWKKKKKSMSPEDFKILSEEHLKLKASNAAAVGDIETLEKQVSEKDNQIIDLQKQATRMQAAYQAAQKETENLKAQLANRPAYNADLINGEDFGIGVVFKVQVGAFRKVDLKKYADTSEDFAEEKTDDLRKYIIGNFRNYEDANILKRYLREMGVEDAWIVPYRDGVRVPLKDVLPNAKAND
uniref:Ezrin/radixin/moesin family protein n=1 Tax=Roseivirga sp. TaxID=1964215 RepID=UPI0040487E7F